MSIWTIVLVSIGVMSIVISLVHSKHPPSNTDLLAVSRSMPDETIAERLRERRWRVDARLGIQYGIAFVFLGILWETLLYLYWF